MKKNERHIRPANVGGFFYDTIGRAMKVIGIKPSTIVTVTCCANGLQVLVYEKVRFEQAVRDGAYKRSVAAKAKWIKAFNKEISALSAEQKKLLEWYAA